MTVDEFADRTKTLTGTSEMLVRVPGKGDFHIDHLLYETSPPPGKVIIVTKENQ